MLVVMGALGVATVAGLIVTLGEVNRQRDRALILQSHSYDVMILARTLSGAIARSEASLGRYVISGDKQQGTLYFDEWRLAGQQINRIDLLTRDSPSQTARIARLRAAYETRGAELSLTALSTNYGKNNQALSRYYAARKAVSLMQINELLDQIIRTERALLDRRTTAAMASVERSSRTARWLSALGTLLVIGAIALGWLTIRAMTQRGVARADAIRERERADELSDAVDAATAELRQQEARLRQVQKMEAVGQLTGGIAHDFNNMLAVVLGGLELAQRNLANGGDVARHLDSATEGATRAAALTRQLLAFAREGAINPEPIDAGGLLSGMSNLLDRTLGDAITVEIEDASDGWRVRADRVQFENTILNLAVNARDAMDGRGTLTIVARAQTLAANAHGACAAGDYLTIAVTDTGCGMAPDIVERAFEPFFTTKSVGQGTGLGLSQIFAFVRQLKGEIAIDSLLDEGTTVTLYLPRDQSGAAVPRVVDIAPPASTASEALTILVVEDDPRVLAASVGALEELGHYPIPCDDPLAAPQLLAEHGGVDLILSDVLMPTQTGPEMIAALGPEHAHIAVLFVTGFAGEMGDGDAFGGQHVLRKPFTLVGLERAIDAAMAKDRPVGPAQIAAE
ncbi:ATP-binding protein [Sphingomonas sp. SUN019]|uniref:ATP-binding protein n=1 Tax=Sphingomonas sp. SUN019 TaxID=2937788 RepID=UPI0021643B58|nr:ATP-binding protein [Sphingomonas sp. SUN019]UVO52538.1 ATP-binding protein [Sphingomonas sp. SUN019]